MIWCQCYEALVQTLPLDEATFHSSPAGKWMYPLCGLSIGKKLDCLSSLVAEWIKGACYKLIRLDNSCLTQSSKRHASPWRGLWESGSLTIAEVGPEVTIVLVLLLPDLWVRRKKIFFFFHSYLFLLSLSSVCTQRDMQQKHIKEIHDCAIPHIFGHLPLGLLFSHHLFIIFWLFYM